MGAQSGKLHQSGMRLLKVRPGLDSSGGGNTLSSSLQWTTAEAKMTRSPAAELSHCRRGWSAVTPRLLPTCGGSIGGSSFGPGSSSFRRYHLVDSRTFADCSPYDLKAQLIEVVRRVQGPPTCGIPNVNARIQHHFHALYGFGFAALVAFDGLQWQA